MPMPMDYQRATDHFREFMTDDRGGLRKNNYVNNR